MPTNRRAFGRALAGGTLGMLGAPARALDASRAGSGAALPPGGALTDVAGVRVGHFSDPRRPTGCTAVLVESGAVCGVDVRGGAPGTRETDLLDPSNTVEQVHAIVLSGGSAFGLDAAAGVVRWLEARGVGFAAGPARVPIVPAAILFDLDLGDWRIRPDAASGQAAAQAATGGSIAEGSVGAGAGATVGKLFGFGRAMKGGLGTSGLALPSGLIVAALVAVNAVGDIVDPTSGRLIAGARTPDGLGLEDTLRAVLEGRFPPPVPTHRSTIDGGAGDGSAGRHTTIGVVATNARLDKAQARKVAQMAHDGLARTIRPVHTPWDGDTLFALSLPAARVPADPLVVGTLAAEAVARAVVRGVRLARGLPGLPSASELGAA